MSFDGQESSKVEPSALAGGDGGSGFSFRRHRPPRLPPPRNTNHQPESPLGSGRGVVLPKTRGQTRAGKSGELRIVCCSVRHGFGDHQAMDLALPSFEVYFQIHFDQKQTSRAKKFTPLVGSRRHMLPLTYLDGTQHASIHGTCGYGQSEQWRRPRRELADRATP